MNRGKLIVLEGSDGAGKGTQQSLLIDHFKRTHIPYSALDFPQYYKTFFGKWIGRFLSGEFGGSSDVPPYIVSIPFAADRWQAKGDIEHALKEGKIVVANRYTGSNAAYQAAKLAPKERDTFVDWDFQMEYEEFGIPKEDLVIFLYVPFAISQKLLEQKTARKYLGNQKKKDIHEGNIELMQQVELVYLEFCKRFPHWVKVDCFVKGEILTREEIHEKVLAVLRKKKFIP